MTKKTERPAANRDREDSVANPFGELISTKHGLYRRLPMVSRAPASRVGCVYWREPAISMKQVFLA
jgi:hypothetical protein